MAVRKIDEKRRRATVRRRIRRSIGDLSARLTDDMVKRLRSIPDDEWKQAEQEALQRKESDES